MWKNCLNSTNVAVGYNNIVNELLFKILMKVNVQN